MTGAKGTGSERWLVLSFSSDIHMMILFFFFSFSYDMSFHNNYSLLSLYLTAVCWERLVKKKSKHVKNERNYSYAMYNCMLYLNSCTLSFKLYLVSTVREKKILYFLTLATEFVYCFQIQQLFLRNFCQGITNDSRQGIWLDQMYSDTGTLTVTQSETGQSSGKLLHKSGLAPPKSDESIWIYGAESRTQPLCLTNERKEKATRTSASYG